MAARRFRPGILAVLATLLAAGTTGYLYLRRPPQPAPPPAPADSGAAPAPSTTVPVPDTGGEAEIPPTPPDTSIPSLGESDDFVRDLAGTLSSNPGLAAWLPTEGLVRRFAAVVDNVAAGDSPRVHVGFMAPAGGFQVRTHGQRITIDPASYARYDPIADVIASLDPEGCVAVYQKAKPLIDAAYRELGYTKPNFDDTLTRAIATLLAVPVVDGEVALTPKVVTFAFADPALEKLSPAQKHLLRMGPRNVRAIQHALRAIAEALALPPPGDPTAAPPSPG